MKYRLAGLVGGIAVMGVLGAPAFATPNPDPASTPASCHGYDISTFAREFGGVAQVAKDPSTGGPGFTVQSAQKADQSYCKTGVLPPAP